MIGGDYYIRSISSATWDLGETKESSYSTAANPHRLAKAHETSTRNFFVLRKATITGVFYDDKNADGERQDNEPVLAGQKLSISVINGISETTLPVATWNTTSDDLGRYSVRVPVQQFNLTPIVPSGRRSTLGTEFTPYTGIAEEGETVVVDVGLTTQGTISGLLSIFPSEEAGHWFDNASELNGWKVFLDTNDNGKLDTGEVTVTTHDAKRDSWSDRLFSTYVFPSVTKGTYNVRILRKNSSFRFISEAVSIVQIASGARESQSFNVAKTWSVSGVVYGDDNENGVQNAGDVTIRGATVFVDKDGDNILDPKEKFVVTDSDGKYRVTDLLGDEHRIGCLSPAGWRSQGGRTVGPTVAASVIRNFLLTKTAAISGLVFYDDNGNGKKDASEEKDRYNEWSVWLDIDGDKVQDEEEPIQIQPFYGGKGTFRFNNLKPGTYWVRFIRPLTAKVTTLANVQVIVGRGDDRTDISFGWISRD